MIVHWASLSGSTCSSYLQAINGQFENLLLDMKTEVGDYGQRVWRDFTILPASPLLQMNRTCLVNQVLYKCQLQLKTHAGILGKNSRF